MHKLILLGIVAIVATSFISCGPSRSQRELQVKNIKVIVLDTQPKTNSKSAYHKHKVKMLDSNTVTFVSLLDMYEKNDTILVSKA